MKNFIVHNHKYTKSMNKNEILVSIAIAGLTVLFATVSIAVFLSKGKSKFWVAKKMKIGGILLTLSAATACGGSGIGGGEVMCYDVPAPNNMWLINLDYTTNTLNINFDSAHVMRGNISMRNTDKFSYLIKDTNNNKLESKNLEALDGNFDTETEEFKITLDKKMKSGNYILELFAVEKELQDSAPYPANQFNLKVIND